MEIQEFRSIITAALLSAWLLAPNLAGAADPSPPAVPAQRGPASDSTSQLEEVVVTARKREERLQDVPVAVTAFTAAMLQNRAVKDITDLALQTPGFAMQNYQRITEQPFIRGQSINSSLYPRQTVSSFLDGIWVQGLGRAIMFEDVERVEVLKGPQATVFGRASFAGAINYVAKRPTFDPQGMVELEGGEYGEFQGSVGISRALIGDKLAARLFVGGYELGPQWRNTTDGRAIGRESNQEGSLSFLLVPSSHLDALFRVQYAHLDDGNQPQVVTRAANNNCVPSASGALQLICGELPISSPPPITQYLAGTYQGGFKRYSEWRGEIVANYTADAFRITSQTGYNDGRLGGSSDGSLLGAPVLGGALLTYFQTYFHDFSEDLRISSVGEKRLHWMLGTSYLNAFREDNDQLYPTLSLSAPYLTKNISGYGQIGYDFLPQLTGTVEARYQSENVQRQGLIGGIHYETTFDKFLPRLSLQYKPLEDVMFYASAAEGNKPGFFNTTAGLPAQYIPVKEEESRTYEIGTKSQWLDRRIKTNVAAYYIDWKNLAAALNVGKVDANGNPVIVGGLPQTVQATVNAAKAHVDGFELEADAALTRGWTAGFTYSYIHAVFDDYVSRVQGALGGAQQVKGNELWNSPQQKLTLTSTYRGPVPGWDGVEYFGSGDLTWRDRQYVDELNTAWIPSMYLLNARIGIEGARWTFSLIGRNLNNTNVPDYATRYLSDYTHAPLVPNYIFTLRPERNVSARFVYRF